MAVSQTCPWHSRYTVGAFAADSIVRLLDDSVANLLSPFHSSVLKRLVRLRWGCTLDITTSTADDEARFAGAVLAKIAQRGFPAPCSLDLERFLLKQASQAGLIKYDEKQKAGAFTFRATSRQKNLGQSPQSMFLCRVASSRR
jgi:hypothetical protein